MKTKKLNLKMLLEEEEAEELDLDFGEDTTATDAGDDGDVPEDADTEAADDKGDTETEEEIEIKPEDEAQLKNPLEAQVDDVLADFEMAALKSAKINETSLKFLLEEQGLDFDVNSFAEDTARLLDNYETLLDIESAIYYRASAILDKNYGKDVADAFQEIMQEKGWDFGDVRPDPVEDVAPLAVGSGGEAGGG
jgi:hypothetical protein